MHPLILKPWRVLQTDLFQIKPLYLNRTSRVFVPIRQSSDGRTAVSFGIYEDGAKRDTVSGAGSIL